MGGKQSSSSFKSFLKSLDEIPEVMRCIDRICGFFEIDFITYHLAFQEGKAIDMPYIKTNYPAAWVCQYVISNYIDIDPIPKYGFTRALPCLFTDMDWKNPALLPFMRDAKSHGIGSSGYIVPLADHRHRRAVVSFSAKSSLDTWTAKIAENANELQECASLLHSKAIYDLYGETSNQPLLSPRQADTLTLVAEGYEAASIGRLLGISEHTVRDYCKTAKIKLNCNNLSQAVHKATKLHLINPK